jgi:hypothetical protein
LAKALGLVQKLGIRHLPKDIQAFDDGEFYDEPALYRLAVMKKLGAATRHSGLGAPVLRQGVATPCRRKAAGAAASLKANTL